MILRKLGTIAKADDLRWMPHVYRSCRVTKCLQVWPSGAAGLIVVNLIKCVMLAILTVKGSRPDVVELLGSPVKLAKCHHDDIAGRGSNPGRFGQR